MKKYLIPIYCFLCIILISSCESDKTKTEDTENGIATVAPIDTTLTSERTEYYLTATRNIILQKQLAEMAIKNTQTRNAKAYGQDLSDWATTKHNELQEMAGRYNITLPNDLEKRQLKHIKDVEEEKATDYKYDLELWDSIKDAQKDAIEDLDKSLKKIGETDATAFTIWSRNTLQELRAHLTQAAALELELKNREGGIAKPIVEGVHN